MNKTMSYSTLQEQINEIESLPPFPLLGNILKSFLHADNNGDIRPLISNIESEPSVAAKVIGISNSAFYGGSDNIKTIRDAVARIGLLQLKSIVYSLVLSSRFKTRQCPHFLISRFWYDSMMLAHCARNVYDHLRLKNNIDRNEIYSIGLFQRIGLLVLIELYPEKMEFILASDRNEMLGTKIFNTFGIDHYTASAVLLKHWSLPASFYHSIENIADQDYKGDYEEIIWILQQAREILHNIDDVENISLYGRLVEDLNIDILCKIIHDTERDSSWIKSFADHL